MTFYNIAVIMALTPLVGSAQEAERLKFHVDEGEGNHHQFVIENKSESPLVSYVVLVRAVSNHTGQQVLNGWDFYECSQKREPTWLAKDDSVRLSTAIEENKMVRHEYEVGAGLFLDGTSFGQEKWVGVLKERRKAIDEFLSFSVALLRDKRREGATLESVIPIVEARRAQQVLEYPEPYMRRDIEAKFDWFLSNLRSPSPARCEGCPPASPNSRYNSLIESVVRHQDKIRTCWGGK